VAENTNNTDYIAELVAQWRKQKGWTLQQLADEVNVSAAFISQVEHGKVSPSIFTLRSLAKALGRRTVDFFIDELVDDPVVMPEAGWTEVDMPGWDATIRQMVRLVGNKQMQPFHTVIQPGGGSPERYAHPGEEFGVVLKGEMTLTVGDRVSLVRAVGSFYYSCLLPHAWVNEGDEACEVVWVVTPPSW
jgi:transcriptional regulator with XRE-family HTH domain